MVHFYRIRNCCIKLMYNNKFDRRLFRGGTRMNLLFRVLSLRASWNLYFYISYIEIYFEHRTKISC